MHEPCKVIRHYLPCYLLEIARRGDDLPATTLQGLGNKSGDLRERKSRQLKKLIKEHSDEAGKLGLPLWRFPGVSHFTQDERCNAKAKGKLPWATAGEHSNKWSPERTHLSVEKVTPTTCSKQTWTSQILMLINIYTVCFCWHIEVTMKVPLHDAVLIQSQTSPALPSAWSFQPILSSQQARTLKSETHTFCAGLDPVCCHPGPEPRIRREKKSDRWKKGRGKKNQWVPQLIKEAEGDHQFSV